MHGFTKKPAMHGGSRTTATKEWSLPKFELPFSLPKPELVSLIPITFGGRLVCVFDMDHTLLHTRVVSKEAPEKDETVDLVISNTQVLFYCLQLCFLKRTECLDTGNGVPIRSGQTPRF